MGNRGWGWALGDALPCSFSYRSPLSQEVPGSSHRVDCRRPVICISLISSSLWHCQGQVTLSNCKTFSLSGSLSSISPTCCLSFPYSLTFLFFLVELRVSLLCTLLSMVLFCKFQLSSRGKVGKGERIVKREGRRRKGGREWKEGEDWTFLGHLF